MEFLYSNPFEVRGEGGGRGGEGGGGGGREGVLFDGG